MTTDDNRMSGPRRIWLVRHGESRANTGERSPDFSRIPLTDRGRSQAEAVAAAMPAAPDLIVASPYLRARQTALATVRRFSSVPFEVWPVQEFTHLDEARCRNTTPEERQPLVDAYWERAAPDHIDGPGCESFAQFIGRIGALLDKAASRPERHIVVFTHERILQAVTWTEARPDPGDNGARMRDFWAYAARTPYRNGAILKLTESGAGWSISSTDEPGESASGQSKD